MLFGWLLHNGIPFEVVTMASTRLSYFQLDVMAFHGHESLKVKNLFEGRGKVLKHLQLCLKGCKSDEKILFLIYLIDFEI
jgi:hypothetical protein